MNPICHIELLGADIQTTVGRVGQGLPVMVDPGAADISLGVGEREVFLLRDVFEHAQRLGHYLGPDVVSSENGKLECRHGRVKRGKRGQRLTSVIAPDGKKRPVAA